MDLYDALLTRRSIRKYSADTVSDEDIHLMLEAAMNAPSAKNEQPWHFVAVRKNELRQALAKTSPYTHMAEEAPLVIVVCADLNCDNANGMWPQDCAAAVENLMLAARGKNIGSVWCGVYPQKEREDHIRAALNLPENIIPFALVCLGHTDKPFKRESRFREDRVHMEKW